MNVFSVCASAIDWDNLFCSAEELLTAGILLACFYGHLEERIRKDFHRSSHVIRKIQQVLKTIKCTM